jgi:5-methylcytosine-specific restriction endonuclease McrA
MPPGWASTRSRILRRDRLTCRLAHPGCLIEATEVHHVFPGIEADWALVSACGPCHKAETSRQAHAARAAL